MNKVIFGLMLGLCVNVWGAYNPTVTVYNTCTNIISGCMLQIDYDGAPESWTDVAQVTSSGQATGKMGPSSSANVSWGIGSSIGGNVRLAYYTNSTATGTKQYVGGGHVATNELTANLYAWCANNPCVWYYSFCAKNTSTMSQSMAVFQYGQPLCWPQPLGTAYITLGPGESGCLKGGPLCDTNGLTVRWNPNGVDCLNNMDGCISVCSNGWSDISGANPKWGAGAPPSDTPDNYNPGAGTETDSGSLSNVVWSGSATNLENLYKEGTAVIKDAIDQNTLNDTKNADRLKGSIDGLGASMNAGFSGLSNALGGISGGGGSNVVSIDMGWTNTLNSIDQNVKTNPLAGFSWSTPTNYDQARAFMLANTHAAGGINTLDAAVSSANSAYHDPGGPGSGEVTIPIGMYSMVISPTSGQLAPLFEFARNFTSWLLVMAYFIMIAKDAYTLVADMGKVRPIQVPNYSVHGYNLGVVFVAGYLLAALAAYAACLAIWSAAAWNVGISSWGSVLTGDIFGGVSGAVSTGLGWFKAAFPLQLFMALLTSTLVWKLTMTKAMWIATMILKALIGA